jgi:hypothetical protein
MNNEFRDEFGQFHTEKWVKGENGISYTGDNVVLGGEFSDDAKIRIVNAHYNQSKKRFQMAPWDDRQMSHDNVNGLFVLLKGLSQKIPGLTKIIKYALHPRDLFFYGNLKGALWARPFLWITSICFIENCRPQWKIRPWLGKVLWVKLTYNLVEVHDYFINKDYEFLPKDEPNNGAIKSYDGNEPGWKPDYPKRLVTKKWLYVKNGKPIYITKSFAVDGKRLNFQRFCLLDMPKTAKICDWVCRKFYGDNYGEAFYHIFYRNIEETHPTLKLVKDKKPNYLNIRGIR